jgi:hypothetical protein
MHWFRFQAFGKPMFLRFLAQKKTIFINRESSNLYIGVSLKSNFIVDFASLTETMNMPDVACG